MARRFRFRLETVLRLRLQARDERRRGVAEAARTVSSVEDRIAQLTSQARATVLDSRRSKGVSALDVGSLRGHQLYQGWLHRKIMESRMELTKRDAELATEREKLAEAMKRAKVIEKLRQKQWLRHREEVAREERAQQDEAAQQLYIRRKADSEVYAA